METIQPQHQETITNVYQYAANLLVNEQMDSTAVIGHLMDRGLDGESAFAVVDNIEKQIIAAKVEKANKDMLYGALWCVGGIVLTMAQIGFIFWGAIVFGAVQFFRGVAVRIQNT